MRMTRFVGAPRAVINQAVGEMVGWRNLGERVLRRSIELCPVGEEGEGWQGPHLRDTLELRVITGSDPRLLIGSSRKGDVLAFVTDGTAPHEIVPVNAQVLRFTKGGTVVFAARVYHPGTKPNPFIMQAIQQTAREAH